MNNDWLDKVLMHSFKGTTWGDHKYIAIKNGRYIYPEDLKSQRSRYNRNSQNQFVSGNRQNNKISYKGNVGLFSAKKNRINDTAREARIRFAQSGYNGAVARNDHQAMSTYSQMLQNLNRPVDAKVLGGEIVRSLIPKSVRRVADAVGRVDLQDITSDVSNTALKVGDEYRNLASGFRDMVSGREDPFAEIKSVLSDKPVDIIKLDPSVSLKMKEESQAAYLDRQRSNQEAIERQRQSAENFNQTVDTVRNLVNIRRSFNRDPIGTMNLVASRLQYAIDLNDPVAIAEAEEEYNYVNSLAR